jgi:hypothetical protein
MYFNRADLSMMGWVSPQKYKVNLQHYDLVGLAATLSPKAGVPEATKRQGENISVRVIVEHSRRQS